MLEPVNRHPNMQPMFKPVWGVQKSPNRPSGSPSSLSCRSCLTVVHLFIFLFASISALVPIRLYENLQTQSAGGPSNAVEASAETYNRLTYNSLIPSGVAGYSHTWSHSTNDPSVFGVTFFSGQQTNTFSYKSTLKWTNIKSATTSLFIPTKQLIAIGTSSGIGGQGLFLAAVDYNTGTNTFSSPTTTAVATESTLRASLLRYDSATSYLYFCGTLGNGKTTLVRMNFNSFSAGGAIPTFVYGSGYFYNGVDSIAEWLKIGGFFVFWHKSQALIYFLPTSSFGSANPTSLALSYGTRYAVLAHGSPTGQSHKFHTVSADGTVMQVWTVDLTTQVALCVGTTATSQATEYFFSKPVQVRNTNYIAIMTKPDSTYYLRVYIEQQTIDEVIVDLFTPVDCSDYLSNTLEPYGDYADFAWQSPFVAQFSNTVRSLFLFADACTTRGGDGVCTSCPAGFELTAASVPDNECYPQAYQKAVGNPLTIPQSCNTGVVGCLCSSSDRTVCTVCSADRWTRTEDGPIVGCYSSSDSIPAGYGKVAGTMTVDFCKADYNCATCAADNEKCETCAPGYGFLRTIAGGADAGDVDCVQLNNIDTYGLDSGNRLRACSVTNCKECFASYQRCTKCRVPGPVLKIIDGGAGDLCVATNTETGFGIDTSDITTNTIRACVVSNCDSCQENYASCDSCASAFPFLKITGSPTVDECVATAAVQLFGTDTSAIKPTIRPCASSLNCESCTADYTTCTTCSESKPFRVPVGNKHGCFALEDIPDGYGQDVAQVNKAAECVGSCKKCRLDHTKCTECLATAFFKDGAAAPLDCYPTVNDIPAGFGPKVIGSKSLVPCATSQFCATCTDLFDTCVSCAANRFLYTPSGGKAGCYGTGALAIPDGVGPDIQGNTKTLISCLAGASCKTCTADNRHCTTCNSNYYLYHPENSTPVCVLNTAIVPGYGVESDPAPETQPRALKCANTLCKLCQADYKKCTECLEGPSIGRPHVSYSLDLTSISCWTYDNNAANIPAGHGLDQTNAKLYVARPCAPAEGSACTGCVQNYLSCEFCANPTHYRLGRNGVINCIAPGSFPAGYGPGLGSNPLTLTECESSQNCYTCVDDHRKCSSCASGLGFPILKYVNDGTGGVLKDSCLSAGSGLAGWGADPTESNSLKPCKPGNACSMCPTDFKKCTLCPETYFLWIESAASTKCITEVQIPVGYGKETGVPAGTQARALACAKNYCGECAADHLNTCTECTDPWYLSALGPDLAVPQCVDSANIPEGYRGTAARTTEACLTPNCAACTASAATCTACKSTYFLHSPDKQCYQNTASLPGYRFDAGSKATQQCDTGCKVCVAAANTCTECFPGLFINFPSCYTATTIPDGLGINNGDATAPQLFDCEVPFCDKCAPNHLQCTQCSKSLVHFDGTTWSCESGLPSGYGNDPSSTPPIKTIKCQKSNCDVCATDYTRCTTCKSGTSTYLEEGLGTCYTKAQFPTGFGLNTADSKVVACLTTGCDLCVEDHTVCTKCQNTNGFYMKGTNSCIKKEAFAAREGLNPTSQLVEKCTDSNCLECRDDIGVCKSCSTATGYYLLKSTCISKAQIAAGQGISATNGTVENCASKNCADCFDDYSKCVKCTDSTAFTLSSGTCTEASKGPVVDAQAIRIKASSGSVAIPLGPDQSRVVDSVTAFDLLEGKSYTGNELGVTITIDSTGIGLKFSTGIRIQKGLLRINRRASENSRLLTTGRILLDASPIVIEDFVLLQSSWVASLTGALTIILSILRLPTSLLLFWKYPWTAMAVDTTATQLTYLGLLDGDSLAYPRLIFEMVSALKILPFRFANPFLRWNEATTNCVPIDSYAALGYYCSWLDNYGENFIALLSLVMLALVVHFALGYALRKLAADSKSY